MEGFEIEKEATGTHIRFIYTKKEGAITANDFKAILAGFDDMGDATISIMNDYSDRRAAVTLDRYNSGYNKITFWN